MRRLTQRRGGGVVDDCFRPLRRMRGSGGMGGDGGGGRGLRADAAATGGGGGGRRGRTAKAAAAAACVELCRVIYSDILEGGTSCDWRGHTLPTTIVTLWSY
jgi:hypothetical protein